MPEQSQLATNAERSAQKSETLSAFAGLNLLHIRRQVSILLGMIGRDGIFDQYTVHDISHIDKMLNSLDWIIPDATKPVMSPAEWLMTVLAIYFHDLGMLVTSREFDARDSSDFPRYRDEVLFSGPNGMDYRAKVGALGARADRFLYQEFVRHKHAERVKTWIMGVPGASIGVATDVAAEIETLLRPLGPQFRRDLALVCESHHLDDLHDLKKYKPSQPYGDSDDATVNLQYCAVLLRTADLLHVTADRTPSIAFQVINPTDPISQQEWAKQAAVTRVRPKMGLDDEGQPSERAPKDTIEVHAYFRKSNGFFGLTSYLNYAADQLKKSSDWISATKRQKLARHEFPWRKIDDSQIETEGFLRDTFEFVIDQAKILDLLTGHTLYNDNRVVLRELVQNSIDAIRLHAYPGLPDADSRVEIEWNSSDRLLTVTDNGTGMTQEIVSNFLLKVGTSRYQDPEFVKEHPNFSSISRFGIGVLSAFMIADELEIITNSLTDDHGRQLTLRSVHGKYLIRLLDKDATELTPLGTHGTRIRLRVRPSVDMGDVVDTARLWIVVPGCRVTVKVDNRAPVDVGQLSPSAALKVILAERGFDCDDGTDRSPPEDGGQRRRFRVLEDKIGGVTVAYAVEWQRYFREWAFVNESRTASYEDRTNIRLGTCIEGIRVEIATPGFNGISIVALANVTGPKAPKTNVARSGLEVTPERDEMLRGVYSIYRNHVAAEIEELHRHRSFSLTWAALEGRYMLTGGLLNVDPDRNVRALSQALLDDALGKLQALVVEREGARHAISPAELAKADCFWTVDSALLRSAEPLIREAAAPTSLGRVMEALNIPKFSFGAAMVLCGVNPQEPFGAFAFAHREVDTLRVYRGDRRVDLRWVAAERPGRWSALPPRLARISRARSERFRHGSERWDDLLVGRDHISVEPGLEESAVFAHNQLFVLPGTPIADFLLKWLDQLGEQDNPDFDIATVFVFQTVGERLTIENLIDSEQFVTRALRRAEGEYLRPGYFEQSGGMSGLIRLMEEASWRVFNPSAWTRKHWPS